MKVSLVAASLLLLSSSVALAASPSNASLKGTYAFQSTQVEQVSWGKTVSATCFGVKYTLTLGGQSVGTQIIAGTANFSGTGAFSINATQTGKFDDAASNNTVSIACTSNPKAPYTTNSGSAVFFPAETVSIAGTYSVTSAGTGTMTIEDGGETDVSDISLGQYNASGVAGAFLLLDNSMGSGRGSTGIAILK